MDAQKLPVILHLLRPARGGAAAVVVVFAVGLSFAAKAGYLGWPLGFLLLSGFFKYAYVLFDHTHRGFDEPPALDMDMMNPVNDQRPIVQVLILGLIFAVVKLVQAELNNTVASVLAAAFLLLLPASVAELGLETNVLKAVSPAALARLSVGLGPWYLIVLGVIGAYAAVFWLLSRTALWLPVEVTLGMFAVLSIFSVLGGALYERRDQVGLEVWHSPEIQAERLNRAALREADRTIDAAYEQARLGAHAKAWQILQDWLAERGNQPADYHWVSERVAPWDERYAARIAQEYVDRLLLLQRNGEALDMVGQRLRISPGFRPKSAASTLKVAQIASRGGAPAIARALLGDFAERFAGSAYVDAAADLARHLGD
jgi:hypothetical protein